MGGRAMTPWLVPVPAVAAAVVAATARGARGARAAGWLLVLGAALLGTWALQGLAGSAGSFAIALPAPFGGLTFALNGLGGSWAMLAAALFAATGLVRAGGYRPGGAGTVLMEHALLVAVAWFLASRSPLGLLAGWEAISLLAYLLVVRDRLRVRRAAWALLAVSELGSALLFLALLLMGSAPLLVGLLALVAFGAKAGLFPLLVWVPVAEPEAAGDVAGLLSGLLTAVSVAGFLAVARMVAPPALPLGIVTAALGGLGAAGSAVMGLVEPDAKRVLAYGTLEALGLCFTGLGLAWVLSAYGAPDAAVMAASGALVLLLAHAGAKFSLFVLAGHAERSGLRLLDRMGGLLRRMRRGSPAGLVAAISLAGLPPLGGFLGEWLIIEACFVPTPKVPGLHVAMALAAGTLALVAAAGVTLYLRWFGAVWLGPARTPSAAAVPDVPWPTAAGVSLGALLAIWAGVGAGWILPWLAAPLGWIAKGAPVIAPTYVTPQPYAAIVALGAALFPGLGGSTGNVLFPAGGFSVGSPWDLAIFLVLGVGILAWIFRRAPVRRVPTWQGGDWAPAAPFSAEGLTHSLRLSFAGFLGLSRERQPLDAEGAGGLGPPRLRYRAQVFLRLEHHLYRPLLALAERASGAVRRTQSGRTGHYVIYLLGAVVLGLALLAVTGAA
jgi:hydrogenase-4 component B